jgi:hypothetical protein
MLHLNLPFKEYDEMQGQGSSSNVSQSNSFLVASSRDGSTENAESSILNRANLRRVSTANATNPASASVAPIRPSKTAVVFPPSMTVTLNGVLDFFHVSNFSNASDEEAIFFHSLFFHLEAKAKILAREANGNCDRAFVALLEILTHVP